MKLALSTGWFRIDKVSPEELVKTLEELSIRAVEVDYRLTEEYLRELKPWLRKRNIEVQSVHNFLPWPAGSSQPGGDVFSLACLDESEWERAVKYTVRTVQEASDLECQVVVLHLGKVDFKKGREYYRDLPKSVLGNDFLGISPELLEKRDKLAFPHLDRLKRALDRLLLIAERYEVFLGVENRFHFYEIPSLEELRILFSEFEGSNLKYWHDIGHAEVNARLGLAKHEDYLREFKEKLVGFHLHDVRDLEDHFAPFSGEINWQKLAPYFSAGAMMVIEAHSKASRKELERGVDLLEVLFRKEGVVNANRGNE